MAERIAITRHDRDGTVIDGTARVPRPGVVDDFRDLDGAPLPLPPGSKYHIPVGDWTEVVRSLRDSQ